MGGRDMAPGTTPAHTSTHQQLLYACGIFPDFAGSGCLGRTKIATLEYSPVHRFPLILLTCTRRRRHEFCMHT